MNRVLRSSMGLGAGKKNGNKRKAELSPTKKLTVKKRSALGDSTNVVNVPTILNNKKKALTAEKKALAVEKKALTVEKKALTAEKKALATDKKSLTVEKEDLTAEKKALAVENEALTVEKAVEKQIVFPEGVADFDSECGNDPFQVGIYAQDIFNYYMRRETRFPIKKYLEKQSELNKNMRSILVDWMVEVQENFELNHETLYMAVKLVDLFLGKVFVKRDRLQLVGTTALYISSKFDERSPPIIDDFCYICDDTYPQDELIRMEARLLKALGFDIGIPLSYRFLRRFARCARIEMETLTLARFILESSLMEYDLIDTRDSLMAAASLLLALRLKDEGSWTPTLEFYSGYKLDDLFDLTHRILNFLRTLPPHLKTIKTKYSHKIFFEVAKIPLPDELHL